jgi:hypothetical protein
MKDQAKVELTWINHDGDEITHSFPSINVICPRCEGYGTHLTPSIGQHAYSAEEFYDSFDEEEQEQYFRRGGIYDVQCEECRGNRVVPEVDDKRLNSQDKMLYLEWQKAMEDWARSDAEDRATYRMESGGYCD